MIRDALTVAWKEWQEIPHEFGQGTARTGWLLLGIYLVLFGVVYPMNVGVEYLESSMAIVLPCAAILFVTGAAADSFAGERERHTLDTLLASRLSDRGILFGKILAPMTFGWSCSLAQIVLAWIIADVSSRQFRFYKPELFVDAVAIALALGFSLTATGVLLSLRAQTVRGALQAITSAIVVAGAAPALLRFVPSHQRFLPSEPPWINVLLLALALATWGLIASLIAMARCRRHLLTLV